MVEAVERLTSFLKQRNRFMDQKIQLLTPDASTREYFRIGWEQASAIACVYPEPFIRSEQSYLDVTNLFENIGLPVAQIYDFDAACGVIIQEDFGDIILRDVLERSAFAIRDGLINQAIELIAKIQTATPLAFELNSIASRLRFDKAKLIWELEFFKTHYFESLQKRRVPEEIESYLISDFSELCGKLERRAIVLCHRDFHAANLMLDSEDRLRIIDHQDARIGSVAYDLVSLLLDRVLDPPAPDWLRQKKEFFLKAREDLGLDKLGLVDFDYEFDLITVQRCLKAIGTFSNQTANCGKTNYVQYIRPMFRIVSEACERLKKFPTLQQVVKGELDKS